MLHKIEEVQVFPCLLGDFIKLLLVVLMHLSVKLTSAGLELVDLASLLMTLR